MKIGQFYINLLRTSSDPDPEKHAWAIEDTTRLPQLCQLIGTEDTVFTTNQLRSVGAEFTSGTFARVLVTVHSFGAYDTPTTAENVDDRVDAWHEGKNTSTKLHEHLGLTWEQYATWVEEGKLPLDGMSDPYQCANCERIAERSSLPSAQDIEQRMEPGDTYTDVQCPDCGCPCFPVEDSEPEKLTADDYEAAFAYHRKNVRELDVLLNGEEGAAEQASLVDIIAQVRKEGITIARPLNRPAPQPDGKLTVGSFRQLTQGLPDSAVITYHGYDKGNCLLAYWNHDVWLFPKDGAPTHVVINPGRNYDSRRPGEPAAVEVVVPATTVFTETEMTELLEFARIALADADTFDNIAETSDLSDEYLIALREKLNSVMDSDVRIFGSDPGVLAGDIDPIRVGFLGDRVGATIGAKYLAVFLNDLHDARAHGLNKEDIMRAWQSACGDVRNGDSYPTTIRGNQEVPAIPM